MYYVLTIRIKESKSKGKRETKKVTVNSNSMKYLPPTRLTASNNNKNSQPQQNFSNKENISLLHCLPL